MVDALLQVDQCWVSLLDCTMCDPGQCTCTSGQPPAHWVSHIHGFVSDCCDRCQNLELKAQCEVCRSVSSLPCETSTGHGSRLWNITRLPRSCSGRQCALLCWCLVVPVTSVVANRYDVVAHIIKPATAEEQISYSELGPSQALNYFVSHVSVCFGNWACFSVRFCSGGATNFATP